MREIYVHYHLIDKNNKKRTVLIPKLSFPMNICPNCWNILEDDRAFCKRCGYSGIIFTNYLYNDRNIHCHKHSNDIAIGICNYCDRPVCEKCCEVHPGGISTAYSNHYYCHDCLSVIKKKKEDFINFDKKLHCVRHWDVKPEYKCVICNEPICTFCTYLPVKGLINKKIVREETYCLSCMRFKLEKKYKHCILDYQKKLSPIKKYIF